MPAFDPESLSGESDSAKPAQGRPRRRRRWIAAAVAVLVAADVAAATGVGLSIGRDRSDRPDQARAAASATPTPTPASTGEILPAPVPTPSAASPSVSSTPQDRERVEALSTLLDARARALLEGDRTGWLAGLDASATSFRRKQEVAFSGIRQLPIGQWSYEVRGAGPTLSAARRKALGAQAWVAEVLLRYRFTGFDAVPVRRVLYLTVVQRGGQWRLAADTDDTKAETDRDVWDLGPIAAVRGKNSLIVGRAQSSAALKAYAAQVDRAVAAVTKVWGAAWSRQVVLLVPATQAEMGTLLDSDGKGLDQIAAVTTGQLATGSGGGGATSADRVVVNTSTFTTLGPVGRKVVLTHEVTHVATRETTRALVPSWLAEGFADYVGYLASGVPVKVAAEDVLDAVRAGKTPKALPSDADFDPSKKAIANAYEGAWLACKLIADRKGQAGLVQFYRIAAGSTGRRGAAATASAFRTVVAATQAQFVAQWRAYLGKLAAT